MLSLPLQVWISFVQKTLRPIPVSMAIGITQSLSIKNNLYQGKRRFVKWQNTHCCGNH